MHRWAYQFKILERMIGHDLIFTLAAIHEGQYSINSNGFKISVVLSLLIIYDGVTTLTSMPNSFGTLKFLFLRMMIWVPIYLDSTHWQVKVSRLYKLVGSCCPAILWPCRQGQFSRGGQCNKYWIIMNGLNEIIILLGENGRKYLGIYVWKRNERQ